tara:strand:- start:70 stop:339 length:270 start_codon:yes stop_codon:yes gene_type:complete
MNPKFAKKYLISLLRESLNGIPNSDNPDVFSIKKSLLLVDDDTGIEYTVSDVDISDIDSPVIKCYRFNPDGTRAYIDIPKQEFKKYSRG